MDSTDHRRLSWFFILLGTGLSLFGLFAVAQGLNGPRWTGATVELVAAVSFWCGLFGLVLLGGGILLLRRAPARQPEASA